MEDFFYFSFPIIIYLAFLVLDNRYDGDSCDDYLDEPYRTTGYTANVGEVDDREYD